MQGNFHRDFKCEESFHLPEFDWDIFAWRLQQKPANQVRLHWVRHLLSSPVGAVTYLLGNPDVFASIK